MIYQPAKEKSYHEHELVPLSANGSRDCCLEESSFRYVMNHYFGFNPNDFRSFMIRPPITWKILRHVRIISRVQLLIGVLRHPTYIIQWPKLDTFIKCCWPNSRWSVTVCCMHVRGLVQRTATTETISGRNCQPWCSVGVLAYCLIIFPDDGFQYKAKVTAVFVRVTLSISANVSMDVSLCL